MKRSLVTLALLSATAVTVFAGVPPAISHPKVKWTFKTQGTIRGSSVIDGSYIYFGSADGYLYALNKINSDLLWKFNTQGAIAGAPAVAGTRVYIASRDNYIYSVDTRTGKLTWTFKTQPLLNPSFLQWDYFTAAPVIAGDKLLAASGDGYLYALNNNNGKLLWKFKTNGRVRATALVVKNTVYQPSSDGFVYVIDLNSGKLKWTFETEGATLDSKKFGFDRNSIYTQPVLENNLLLFGSRDGNVYAVDINTHQQKWKFNYDNTWAMGIASDNDAVFVNWSTNNVACAIDLQTGKEKWKFLCGAHTYTKPVIAGDELYIGSADGKLYDLDKHTGQKKWQYETGSEIYSSPVYDDAAIFFGCDNGYFYALEQGSQPYKAVYQPPVITGNEKYLITDSTIAPYLKQKGFDQLDSAGLYRFISNRINDKAPSVIVFTLPVIPRNIFGDKPGNGMLRKYLDTGGKIIWFGDSPAYFEPDGNGNFKPDTVTGSRLLDVQYTVLEESGNYYSKSTQQGLNWGLPSWFKTVGAPVSPKGVIPLAYDEYNRVSVWIKKFNPRPGSGFISCRSWSWFIPAHQEDLSLIWQLAVHELE